MQHTDQIFSQTDFTEQLLVGAEFDTCRFENCQFAGVDLTEAKFIDCQFDGCDLSLAVFNNTALRDCHFTNCKLLGLRFDDCRAFGFEVSFQACLLDNASFYGLDLTEMVFKDLRCHGTDFTRCNLTGAVFDDCDLEGALFEQCNLEKADFRTAENYAIHPEVNRLTGAKFSASGLSGLLRGYDIEIDFGG